jgi:hypothetical protein
MNIMPMVKASVSMDKWKCLFVIIIFSKAESRRTPELTGRARNAASDKFTMKGTLTRAPVE